MPCDMMTLAIRSKEVSPTFKDGSLDCAIPTQIKNCSLITRTSRLLFLSGVMTLALCFQWSATGRAEVNPNQAILAIVGEAENQGLIGMTAVAEAIRNRGTLKGVYGLKSPRLKKAPKWVFSMARKAWEDSQNSNLTNGATHWENTKSFGVPYWAKPMKKTAVIKDHAFYKAVNL